MMTSHTRDGIRYLTFDSFPASVKHAIFTRHGGHSPQPWASLNMGNTVGDERPRVRENRHRAFESVGRDPNSMYDVWQVHSADVVVSTAPHAHFNNPPELRADGIVTDNPQVTLFMRFADCTPILLCDPRKGIVSIVHAGWMGTVKKAAAAAVRSMVAAYASNPADIIAGIGPSIGPDHYEVGEDVVSQVRLAFGADADSLLSPPNKNGKPHFDLWSANRVALEQAGVGQVEIAGVCTACHTEDWFSHRAEKGKTGRFGALIALD